MEAERFSDFRCGFVLRYGEQAETYLSTQLDLLQFSLAPLMEAMVSWYMGSVLQWSCGWSERTVAPALRGTSSCNYASIMQRGFVIPGHGSGIEVVNGRSYGDGIYVASLSAAGAKLACEPRFARDFIGQRIRVFLCAVVNDDPDVVHRHRDALLISEPAHVIPICIISGARLSDNGQALAVAERGGLPYPTRISDLAEAGEFLGEFFLK